MLRPRPEVIERRELERNSSAYAPWIGPDGTLRDAVLQFDTWLAETPRIGLWIDSSDLTIDETVNEVLDRWLEARVE